MYLNRKYNEFNRKTLRTEDIQNRQHANTIEAVTKRKLDFLIIYALVKSVSKTCEYIGIKDQTHYQWLRKDLAFKRDFCKIQKNSNENNE
ncbi:hypothetical protein GH754_02830 [Salinibacillus xinjiangensis]|uniref:Uncharacterized protein n=1 Tax=Salinibacillus xinjiangensis TaxID=1229268 RepID=A0A6G1X2W6_9BACI|nr:hypothetical protein [Salinibacillus xinjiangensis]